MLSCLLGAACAGAPAVRSRWNLLTRSNVVHTAVEAIHGTGGRSVDAPLTPADRAYAALHLLFDPEQCKSPDPCASTPTRSASAPATDDRSGARDAALAQATDMCGGNESSPSCCPHGARPAPHASVTHHSAARCTAATLATIRSYFDAIEPAMPDALPSQPSPPSTLALVRGPTHRPPSGEEPCAARAAHRTRRPDGDRPSTKTRPSERDPTVAGGDAYLIRRPHPPIDPPWAGQCDHTYSGEYVPPCEARDDLVERNGNRGGLGPQDAPADPSLRRGREAAEIVAYLGVAAGSSVPACRRRRARPPVPACAAALPTALSHPPSRVDWGWEVCETPTGD